MKDEIEKLGQEIEKPPSSWAVMHAKAIISGLQRYAKPDRVIPMADGGLGIVYPSAGTKSARINVTNDQEIVITLANAKEGAPTYLEAADTSRAAEAVVDFLGRQGEVLENPTPKYEIEGCVVEPLYEFEIYLEDPAFRAALDQLIAVCKGEMPGHRLVLKVMWDPECGGAYRGGLWLVVCLPSTADEAFARVNAAIEKINDEVWLNLPPEIRPLTGLTHDYGEWTQNAETC